jgi:hypothetical protein
MSSTPDLGVEWRRSKQGGILKLVNGGGGVAHRKWRRRRGKSLVKGHEVGRASAMVRSLCELE